LGLHKPSHGALPHHYQTRTGQPGIEKVAHPHRLVPESASSGTAPERMWAALVFEEGTKPIGRFDPMRTPTSKKRNHLMVVAIFLRKKPKSNSPI